MSPVCVVGRQLSVGAGTFVPLGGRLYLYEVTAEQVLAGRHLPELMASGPRGVFDHTASIPNYELAPFDVSAEAGPGTDVGALVDAIASGMAPVYFVGPEGMAAGSASVITKDWRSEGLRICDHRQCSRTEKRRHVTGCTGLFKKLEEHGGQEIHLVLVSGTGSEIAPRDQQRDGAASATAWVVGHGGYFGSEETFVPKGWKVNLFSDKGEDVYHWATLAALAGAGPRVSYDDTTPIPNYVLTPLTVKELPGGPPPGAAGKVPDDSSLANTLASFAEGTGTLYVVGLPGMAGGGIQTLATRSDVLDLCTHPACKAAGRHVEQCNGLFNQLRAKDADTGVVNLLVCSEDLDAGGGPVVGTVAIGDESRRPTDRHVEDPGFVFDEDDDRLGPSLVRKFAQLGTESQTSPADAAMELERMPQRTQALSTLMGSGNRERYSLIWNYAQSAGWPAEADAPVWFSKTVYGHLGSPPARLVDAWADPEWRNAFWFCMNGVGRALGWSGTRECALLAL